MAFCPIDPDPEELKKRGLFYSVLFYLSEELLCIGFAVSAEVL
jgi:hypothetical protein